MSERHIELVWRCTSCANENLGRCAECQLCGNRKDDSEEYEMPADPSAVESVTDPALLAIAKGGENWSCKYCGSNQRNAAGECRRCGGDRIHAARAEPEAILQARRSRVPVYVLAGILGAGVIATRVLITRRPPPAIVERVVVAPPRTTFTATITGVSWRRSVDIETRQLGAHQGFTSDVPAGASKLQAAGQHVHHEDQVLDHEETV